MRSLRPALLAPWLAAAALLGGCSLAPAATEDDDDTFVHRAYTAWQPLPSKDGSRLAFALEPRRVDADSHGVMVTGWRGRVAGDGVVVAASDGPPSVLTTVPRGFLDADGAESDLFVWTKAASEWTPVAPNDMPPPTPYASVTWLDRATFAVKGTRAFSPPLEMPIAVGGSWVLDTPRLGQSDFERDVHLALHDVATGAVQVLHDDRGFAVSTCSRGSAVTVAYQRGKDRTTILDVMVTGGVARVARLDLDDLFVDALACRAGGEHVAAVGGRPSDREGRALVLARSAEALAVAFESSVGAPVALSRDGSTLLATGPDRGMMLVTKRGARPLPGVTTTSTKLLVSGDRAFVDGGSSGFVVRLDGQEPSASKVPFAEARGEHVVSATGGGGFLAFETRYDGARGTDAITRAFVLDPGGGARDVPLGEAHERPSVAYADAGRAWVVATRIGGPVELLDVDLGGARVRRTTTFPLCDRDAMRNEDRCLP